MNFVIRIITCAADQEVMFEKHIAKTGPSQLHPSRRQSWKLAESVILGHLVCPCQSEIVPQRSQLLCLIQLSVGLTGSLFIVKSPTLKSFLSSRVCCSQFFCVYRSCQTMKPNFLLVVSVPAQNNPTRPHCPNQTLPVLPGLTLCEDRLEILRGRARWARLQKHVSMHVDFPPSLLNTRRPSWLASFFLSCVKLFNCSFNNYCVIHWGQCTTLGGVRHTKTTRTWQLLLKDRDESS